MYLYSLGHMETFPKHLGQKTNVYVCTGQILLVPESLGKMLNDVKTVEYMAKGPEFPEQICTFG